MTKTEREKEIWSGGTQQQVRELVRYRGQGKRASVQLFHEPARQRLSCALHTCALPSITHELLKRNVLTSSNQQRSISKHVFESCYISA